ncbi:ABC transporter permease [Pseudonocardia oroxyli]|uniref:Peptide/nickel transport system permease protein n=1 Tax=Pseudonocardia oroxyli TaxID=366584 RepID=A0A1G8AK13_PSEOR|nr:ABC transporter permease [Pseudonocardia oroxyli]SDH21362.1 peptide/nickel transport system permease protein [Pseudonocardia oroxyli]
MTGSALTRYLAGRVAQAVGVLWAAFTVTFVVLYLLPSDPVALQLGAAGIETDKLTPEQLAQVEAQYGLDQPVLAQYWHYLTGALHGDFGTSFAQGLPVSQLIGERVGTTLTLSLVAGALSLVAGTTLAWLAAYVRWRPLRLFLSRLPSVGASFPQFFIALLLIQLLSFSLAWLPATGDRGWQTLVMPALTIALLTGSMLAQVLMRSFDDTLQQPYITTARATGLSRAAVQLTHAFRNAALPAMTILGVLVAQTVTSAIVVETVFTRDGVGRLAQQAVLAQDVPVVLGVVTLAAAVFVAVNLVVDLLYPLLDPRIVHTPKVSRS